MMFSWPTFSVSIRTNHPQSSLWLTSERWFQRIPASMVVHAGRSILNSRLPSVMQCTTSSRIYEWSLCKSCLGYFQNILPICGSKSASSIRVFCIVLYRYRGMGGSGWRPKGVRDLHSDIANRLLLQNSVLHKTAAECDVAGAAVTY